MALSLIKGRTAVLLIVPSFLALTACESSGSYRVGSVGTGGTSEQAEGGQGSQGSQGSQGPAGPAGANGANGTNGMDGTSGLSLGSAGALAVGGLVGPGGVAGTGLLASTGDIDSTNPVISGVLIKTGDLVNVVADKGLLVADVVDGALPGGTDLVGTVVGVVKSTGIALVQTGNGQQYLVDGLTAAPGELITATIGGATAIGSASASPLIGASILSPGQETGSLLTVGVASNGQLVTLQPGTNDLLGGLGTGTGTGGPLSVVTAVASGVLAPVTGGTPAQESGPLSVVTTVASGVLSPVTGGQPTTGGSGLAPVTNVVSGVTSTVTSTVGGLLGGLTQQGNGSN